MEDRQLAEALIDAAAKDGGTDAQEFALLEAESAIIERLDISPDHTEQGLTLDAVRRIEEFVSEAIGRPWTYEDAGMLGATAESAQNGHRTVLVHLNVRVPADDSRLAAEIAQAILGAIEVGQDDDSVRDLEVTAPLAEQID